MNEILLYYDPRSSVIAFGVGKLRESLAQRGYRLFERDLSTWVPRSGTLPGDQESLTDSGKTIFRIGASSAHYSSLTHRVIGRAEGLAPEGFSIQRGDEEIRIIGADLSGTLYGLLDLAESIMMHGLDSVPEKTENPMLKVRGLKVNLPFEPYDNGDPFSKNRATCLDIEYWRSFIDECAANRYNTLSFWSEMPFPMMFRLQKYPGTCPYQDRDLETYKRLFHFILRHANDRGMKTWLITWNIRITPEIARGLGLPEELGEMSAQFDLIHDKHNGLPVPIEMTYGSRQSQEIIGDYFVECIKTLLLTYPELDGIGTNCAEEMEGDAATRQAWVKKYYREGIRASGRKIPFIMRTNMGNGSLASSFFEHGEKEFSSRIISWKYSNAHMYSHPRPEFESLWEAWKDMDFSGVSILYTLRNDDYHCFRAGDPEFIRAYLTGIRDKGYADGFYWGADGYFWGEEFQHIPGRHNLGKGSDVKKHEYQFALLGRLSYNPALSEQFWIDWLARSYGESRAAHFHKGFASAIRALCAVNRLLWINYDYEWHAESLLSVYGFKSILDFMDVKAMPGVGIVGIDEYARQNPSPEGLAPGIETPPAVLGILDDSVSGIGKAVAGILASTPAELLESSLGCALADLECWAELFRYYRLKISAALKLCRYRLSGDLSLKLEAVEELTAALVPWEKLSGIWSAHYTPYKMVRSKHLFSYPAYIDDVRRDIALARSVTPSGTCLTAVSSDPNLAGTAP